MTLVEEEQVSYYLHCQSHSLLHSVNACLSTSAHGRGIDAGHGSARCFIDHKYLSLVSRTQSTRLLMSGVAFYVWTV